MNSILDKIPGQKRVKETLSNFIESGTIPHAFLFSGIDGVGKDNAAIKFIESVIRSQSVDSYNKNRNFIQQLSEPVVKFIFPLPRGKNETDSSSPTEKLSNDDLDLMKEQIQIKAANPYHKIEIPKANSIKINSIRVIKKFLSYNFSEVGYRFVIISEAHLMNDQAQNALLKNLEEPPENVIFILTTSSIFRLRQTILSRCWRINFDPLSEEEIAAILIDYFNIEKNIAHEVSPFAMGSVQNALILINLDIHHLKEKTISILRYSFGRKYYSAFEELNSVLIDQNVNNFSIIIGMMLMWINDLQKHRLGIDKLFYKIHIDTLEKFNNKFPDVNLNDVTYRLDSISRLPKSNINPSLLSANLIFEISSVILQN